MKLYQKLLLSFCPLNDTPPFGLSAEKNEVIILVDVISELLFIVNG